MHWKEASEPTIRIRGMCTMEPIDNAMDLVPTQPSRSPRKQMDSKYTMPLTDMYTALLRLTRVSGRESALPSAPPHRRHHRHRSMKGEMVSPSFGARLHASSVANHTCHTKSDARSTAFNAAAHSKSRPNHRKGFSPQQPASASTRYVHTATGARQQPAPMVLVRCKPSLC